MGFLMIILLIMVGMISLYFLLKPSVKPFHVNVEPMVMKMKGVNMFPMFHFMMSIMPASMRKQTVTKENAPKPGKKAPRDRYDLTGKTPYKIEEIKPGKIWQVAYDMENVALSNESVKAELKAFGMDPTDEKYQEKCLKSAALVGEDVLGVVRKDLETAKGWYSKENITNEEIMEAGPFLIKMFVVKLNNGSLLLYAPVRMHNEVGFVDWLDSLGPVEWIVVASSFHTLNIQAAAAQFPEAKIIGAPAAEDKLKLVKGLVRNKFDYNCTDQSDLKAVNSLLESEGVKLYYVDGDVACNALVAIAHDTCISCDLASYGHHDGEGSGALSNEKFRML